MLQCDSCPALVIRYLIIKPSFKKTDFDLVMALNYESGDQQSLWDSSSEEHARSQRVEWLGTEVVDSKTNRVGDACDLTFLLPCSPLKYDSCAAREERPLCSYAG